MNRIQQTDGEIYLQIGPWKLWLDKPSFRLISWFGQHVNLPLTLFEQSDHQNVLDIHKLTVKDDTVSFETLSGVTGQFIVSEDKTSLLVYNDKPTGIMWPNVNGTTFFGGEINPVTQDYTQTFSWWEKSDDPTIITLTHPVVTHQLDCYLSVSSDLPVTFCSFRHNGRPYCNAISRGLYLDFIPHKSRSEIIVQPAPAYQLPALADITTMQRLLFVGAEIKKPVRYPHLDKVVHFQKELQNKEIASVVIGSLAMQLHGIDFPCQDVDMIVSSLDGIEGERPTLSKWAGVAQRICFEDVWFDLCVMEGDIRGYFREAVPISGIEVLDGHALLGMKHLGEAERHIMNPWYRNFEEKNKNDILNLLAHLRPPMYRFFSNLIDKRQGEMTRFHKLARILEKCTPSSRHVDINRPLQANTFESIKGFCVAVVNPGETCDMTLTVPGKKINKAVWHGLEGDRKPTIEHLPAFDEIHLDNIQDLGVLECE